MAERVIQGFFPGGRMSPVAARAVAAPLRQPASSASPIPSRTVAQPRMQQRPAGPPPPAFAGRAAAVQPKAAPGRPPLVHRGQPPHPPQPAMALQRSGGQDGFAVDPTKLGLARQGGTPMPQALLAKMEAAFGADFGAVRVHVGPQASRIGAVAFATGNDLYFAPGQYQPDTIRGQQLIGHELAHVIQQRQGRVRSSVPGVAVVEDRALEEEANRLGMRAAAHVVVGRAVQPFRAGAASWHGNAAALQLSASKKRKRKPKKKKKEDPEGDYQPYTKQRRGNFRASDVEDSIRRTAHLKQHHHIDTKRFRNVWTCPACKRPLAVEDVKGKFKLLPYSYTSKNDNLKTQRAIEVDHHPEPWADVVAGLDDTMPNSEFNEVYRDPSNNRAICRVCNGSHAYERADISDYDSSDDDEPPSTPDYEPENAGRWSTYATV